MRRETTQIVDNGVLFYIEYNRKRYNNSTQFYRDYFGSDIETLVRVIKKYKQSHGAHKKDEEYLADLLK